VAYFKCKTGVGQTRGLGCFGSSGRRLSPCTLGKTNVRQIGDSGVSSSAGAILGGVTWARVGPPARGMTGDLGIQNKDGVLSAKEVVDGERSSGAVSVKAQRILMAGAKIRELGSSEEAGVVLVLLSKKDGEGYGSCESSEGDGLILKLPDSSEVDRGLSGRVVWVLSGLQIGKLGASSSVLCSSEMGTVEAGEVSGSLGHVGACFYPQTAPLKALGGLGSPLELGVLPEKDIKGVEAALVGLEALEGAGELQGESILSVLPASLPQKLMEGGLMVEDFSPMGLENLMVSYSPDESN
jgi:hypothetical protein